MDTAQVEKAVKALLKYSKTQKKEDQSLIEESNDFWLMITTDKMTPVKKISPHKIHLPHPIYAEDRHSVCLITKDPQSDFKELLKKHEITNITKVIGVTKLRQKYKQFEAKRQLCNEFDLFLADDRILPMLPKILGKTFIGRRKLPLRVDMRKQDLKMEITEAIESTCFYEAKGSCNAIRVGRDTQGQAEVVANVLAVAEETVNKIPRKWDNIKCIHIKTSSSIALPIYLASEEEAKVETVEKKTRKRKAAVAESAVEEESTKKVKSDFIDIYADNDDQLLAKLSKKLGMKLK